MCSDLGCEQDVGAVKAAQVPSALTPETIRMLGDSNSCDTDLGVEGKSVDLTGKGYEGAESEIAGEKICFATCSEKGLNY